METGNPKGGGREAAMMEQNDLALQERTARISWSVAGFSRSPRILCVDDNEPFLTAFSALLELAGFSVTTASDPALGLKLVRKSSYDLAILDYHMPGINGAQLARKMRQTKADMPMILLSANDSVPAADLRVFNRHLAKGEGFQEVLLAVFSSLANAQLSLCGDCAA
jgi:CheY-like chemotaxis protein